jgi:hypothetical protein
MSGLDWFVIFILAILAIFPAKIASNKGDHFLLWYAYGFFFFPLAFLHALFLEKSKQVLEKEALQRGEVKCPHCKEFVNYKADVCKSCGRDVSYNNAPASKLAESEQTSESSDKAIEKAICIEKLANLGIKKINLFDKNNLTPLMVYAEQGDKDVVMLLLCAGANKSDQNYAGFKASDRAENAGFNEIADLINNY